MSIEKGGVRRPVDLFGQVEPPFLERADANNCQPVYRIVWPAGVGMDEINNFRQHIRVGQVKVDTEGDPGAGAEHGFGSFYFCGNPGPVGAITGQV
jgi:hypothetical protein